jgi:hypothetical protein
MTGDGTSLGHEHVSFVLRNETMTGVVQEFNHLVFHGGLGAMMEMRVFSENRSDSTPEGRRICGYQFTVRETSSTVSGGQSRGLSRSWCESQKASST